MNNAQLKKIQGDIARISKNQLALLKEFKILRKVIAQGEERDYPWHHRIGEARRRQVEAVAEYLRNHANRQLYTVRRAAHEVFKKRYGGYPSPDALASYCYDIKIDDWIN